MQQLNWDEIQEACRLIAEFKAVRVDPQRGVKVYRVGRGIRIDISEEESEEPGYALVE